MRVLSWASRWARIATRLLPSRRYLNRSTRQSAPAVLTAVIAYVSASEGLGLLASPHDTLFGTRVAVWATGLAAWTFIGYLFFTTRDRGLLLGAAISSAVLGVAWLAFGPLLLDLAGTDHLLLSILYPLGGLAVFTATIPLTSFPRANSARVITALSIGALAALGTMAAGVTVGPLDRTAIAACVLAFCYGLGASAPADRP